MTGKHPTHRGWRRYESSRGTCVTERQVQHAILREFGTRSDMRLWRANAGAARIGRRFIQFGIPGQADLTGILTGGRRLEIEVKSATGRQAPDQRAFQALVERFGGLYVLARSVEDVRRAINAASEDAMA